MNLNIYWIARLFIILLLVPGIDVNAQNGCSNWTPLDCSSIHVNLPYNLTWTSSEGGVNDASGVGTGFTVIAPPSARRVEHDGQPTNPSVPGYEPSKLNVNTSQGRFNITTTKGIFFRTGVSPQTGNSQLNSLAVGFDAKSDPIKITTKLVNLPVPGSQNYQQAGIWFGLGEADYVKLVVISHLLGNENYEVQLVYELNDVYLSEQTEVDVIAPGNDLLLELIADPNTRKVQGFFSADNGQTFRSTGPAISVPASFFNGIKVGNSSANSSFAGIYGTHRHANSSLVFSFDNFGIKAIETGIVNRPPTIDPINNPAAIQMNAGQQTVELSGISAGEGEVQTVTISAKSSNPGLIPNPTVNYTSPNTTGTLTYTPVAGQSGKAEITVTVQDDGPGTPPNENTTVRTFTVVVSGADNKAPTLDPIPNPDPIDEDSPQQTVQLTGITAGEGETQTLTVTAVSDNPDLIPNPTVNYTSPNTTGTVSYTPVANAYGKANITVTVKDDGPGVNSFSQTFTVVVNPVNDPPYINEIPEQQTGIGEVLGPVEFVIGDVDNDVNELTVTASSGNQTIVPNENIVLGGNGATRTFTITPAPGQEGTVTITLTVSDGELQGTRDFVLHVGAITSVNEMNRQQILFYPNPTHSELKVEFKNNIMGEVLLQVIDLSGRTHKSLILQKNHENFNYILNLNDLNKGAYFVQIKQKGNIISKKLIKH